MSRGELNEKNCKYVSSRGILKSCDIFSSIPISDINDLTGYDLTKITDNSVLYVSTSAIPYFINHIFKKIKNKIILVSGDSDSTNPSDIFTSKQDFIHFIESDTILHWFSQNCILSNHPKLTQLPIGLDYHTMSIQNHSWGEKTTPTQQEQILENIKSNSKPFYERKIKAYSNFHFFTNTKFGYDRIDAMRNIPSELVYYEPNHTIRINTWNNQAEYAFVISPHGNGLDCHRTWEALCLGCIPIVKTSTIDTLYEDLPVLVLKDWSMLTQEILEQTINEFKNKKFNYNKLTLQYWIHKINSYKITNTNNIVQQNRNSNSIVKYSVIIAGCCINVEQFIEKNLFIIDEIGKQFKEYKVVIYENDSTDSTRELLIKNKKPNYDYIFENNINIKNRTERIAYCRNKILDHINKNYLQYDYLLMLDMDDILVSGKLINTVNTCFLYKQDQWDAMFANCSYKYYDIYALRKKDYLTNCCWNNVHMMTKQGIPNMIAYHNCITKYMVHYPENKKLIPVLSAFGGAGLYKLKSIKNAKYIGKDPNHIDNQICEHVPFNTDLINRNCKLYINPKMIIQ